MIGELLLLLSCTSLSIFLGAQLTEALLLVPHWKRMAPDEFLIYYNTYGKRIHQFFAPLTIIATLIPLCTVGFHLLYYPGHIILLFIMGGCTLAFFSTFFMYFKEANRQFAQGALSAQELSYELQTWSRWHWGRIVLETVALISGLLLLLDF